MSSYSTYITPINLKNPKVKRDWETFCDNYIKYGKATWDKDISNKMKVGDYIGFKIKSQVLFFIIIKDLGLLHRKNERWEDTSYTIPPYQSGPLVNKNREGVLIGHIVGYREYKDIAKCYKSSWNGPRGTQRLTKYNLKI